MAEDEEGFRTNAKSFRTALESYISQGVKQKLSGATPPVNTKSQQMVPEGELDRLWDEVERTAGVTGQEKAYREANEKLQALLAAKQP